jgi:hypothetical protein
VDGRVVFIAFNVGINGIIRAFYLSQ